MYTQLDAKISRFVVVNLRDSQLSLLTQHIDARWPTICDVLNKSTATKT